MLVIKYYVLSVLFSAWLETGLSTVKIFYVQIISALLYFQYFQVFKIYAWCIILINIDLFHKRAFNWTVKGTYSVLTAAKTTSLLSEQFFSQLWTETIGTLFLGCLTKPNLTKATLNLLHQRLWTVCYSSYLLLFVFII